MNFGRLLSQFAPFSYMWVLRRSIGDSVNILDLGCDDGSLMQAIHKPSWKVVGVDIFKKSVLKAQKSGVYEEVILGDVEKVASGLILKKKKYDVVFFSQVIEHISKKKGERMLKLVEKLARDKIIIGTPHGFMNQPEMFLKDNKYQYHRSGWEIEEFTKLGYEVNGIGIKFLWSETGLGRTNNNLIVGILTILSYITSPVAYYFPNLAAGILAIKNVKKK